MKALLLSLVIAMMADVPLQDPAEEARAQALMRELRCVACENEPVSQSSAPIAEDMRARVREMIMEGSSDQDVRDWFESRYGEFVLFRPKGRGFGGTILWAGPFLLLVAGAAIGFLTTRRKRTEAAAIESEDA
ncbi:MAG: cytochrome c-type biogenesis protein [Hyphomonas sp.]